MNHGGHHCHCPARAWRRRWPNSKPIRAKHGPLKNTHKEVRENLSPLNKVALVDHQPGRHLRLLPDHLRLDDHLAGLEHAGAEERAFDPAMGFVLYLFLCNVIQILLMPLIMVGQNLQGMHSEARAEHDLEVNIKAEQEIEVILQHLEQQNDLLMKMVEKLGVDVNEALKGA